MKKILAAEGNQAGSATAELKGNEAILAKLQAEADETNKARTGKGLRVRVGQTRGKNPKVISYEAFDTDKPETLPVTFSEFMELTKVEDEKVLVSYLIDGHTAAMYSAASDVLAEYVEPNWDADFVRRFKLSVSNYVTNTGVSIEDAIALLKPGMVKAFDAKLAAASAQ